MRAWSERPREEANLLTPPFCSLLLLLAIESYQKTAKLPMPFIFSHLLLPIILHKSTREALPKAVSKSLSTWAEEHPTLRALFPDNVVSLKPFVEEALQYGVLHGCIVVNDDGTLALGKKPRGIPKYETSASNEVRDCVHRAQFLGRWFATAGSVPTIMAIWGIKP
jgi:hypothetical protein